MADLYAKAAAENTADTVSKRTLQEASLAHVSRSATEAINTSKTAKWIKTHVKAERRYRPPNGKGRRQELKGRGRPANRYYQFLPGNTAIAPYLCDKTRGIESNERSCVGVSYSNVTH